MLHYSTTNRMIAGVCAGIAETYNIDVSLVRVIFVLLTIFSGVGLVIYLALMLILPKDTSVVILNPKPEKEQSYGKFYRIKEGKLIAGVCTGLAYMLNLDLSIVRVLFVVITVFSSGLPILLYILLWIILPYSDEGIIY